MQKSIAKTDRHAHHLERRSSFFKRMLPPCTGRGVAKTALILAFLSLFFMHGCSSQKELVRNEAEIKKKQEIVVKEAPPPRVWGKVNELVPIEARRFLEIFASADSSKKPMSEEKVLNEYLPMNLYYVKFNGLIAEGKMDEEFRNMGGTAVHIGGGYFMTAAHLVTHLPDCVWTVKDAATFDYYENGVLKTRNGLGLNEVGRNYQLENCRNENERHTFRVIYRDGTLDIAVLEADSTFDRKEKDAPLLWLYPCELSAGDTIVHFMNSIQLNRIAVSPRVLDKLVPFKVRSAEGDSILLGAGTPKKAVGPMGETYYLKIEGYVFPFTPDELYRRSIYRGGRGDEHTYSNICTTLSYNGNSGAPLFVKVEGGYVLAGVASAVRTSVQEVNFLGMGWQQSSTCFGKPSLISEALQTQMKTDDGK